MKFRMFSLCAVLFSTFGISSCLSSDDPEEYPQYYSFVTAVFSQEEGASKQVVSFLNDADKILNVVNNDGLNKKVRPGQRAVIYFDVESGSIEDNSPSTIRLAQIDTCVLVGSSAFVETDEQLRSYGEYPLDVNISPNYPNLTPKYFNLYIYATGSDPFKHKFTLAYNQNDPGDSQTLNLTLCHDTNGDDAGYSYWHWISLPRAEFTSLMLDKKMVNVKIKTVNSGMQSITFRLEEYQGLSLTGRKCALFE